MRITLIFKAIFFTSFQTFYDINKLKKLSYILKL